jgi:hypothetical protein
MCKLNSLILFSFSLWFHFFLHFSNHNFKFIVSCQISDKVNKDQVHTVEILGKIPKIKLLCSNFLQHKTHPLLLSFSTIYKYKYPSSTSNHHFPHHFTLFLLLRLLLLLLHSCLNFAIFNQIQKSKPKKTFLLLPNFLPLSLLLLS